MTVDKELFIPFIIFFILFILNRQFQCKYSHIFEKSIGLILVILYTLIDIKYGIAFGIVYMVYLMRWNNMDTAEGLQNKNNDVEFIIDEPKTPITTDKKYTAVIIEPRNHKALEFVLNNFMENLSDEWGFIIFHSNTNQTMVENITERLFAKYKNKPKLINLKVDSKDFTIKEYSTLFYHENFYKYIPTETFLIFQTDSMILKENKDKIDNFFEYDYVGAPWPETVRLLGEMQVGNGGLSLRKKSKMIELLKYKSIGIDNSQEKAFGKYIAEDQFFNGYLVKNVNIYKPSFIKAKEFSVECVYNENPFGIHKIWAHLKKNELNKLKYKYPDINTLMNLQGEHGTYIDLNPKNEENSKILIVISSKSPNPFLYNCIENLYKIQIKNNPNYKICVIDSDSNDFTNYNKIRREFPEVELHFIKNKNYEVGAWKYAYSKYPNYDKYFCIQDSNIVNSYIDTSIVDNKNAYTCHHNSGYNSHLTIKQMGIELLNYTGLDYTSIINTNFTLAQHLIVVVDNSIMKDLLNTFKELPIDKNGGCCYERNIGIYFIVKKIKTHDLSEKIKKISGGRS